MTAANEPTPDGAIIDRAQERAERAGDTADMAVGVLDGMTIAEAGTTEAPDMLERAAIAQAYALTAIAGYLGALTDLALAALRQDGTK